MPRLAGHSIKSTGLEAHQECEHRKASMWTAVKSIHKHCLFGLEQALFQQELWSNTIHQTPTQVMEKG